MAQYLSARGEPVACLDTDQVNGSFQVVAGLVARLRFASSDNSSATYWLMVALPLGETIASQDHQLIGRHRRQLGAISEAA
jgi:hypothetical protein